MNNTIKSINNGKFYLINHVMSNDVASGIFQSLLAYYFRHSFDNFEMVSSNKPLDDASFYHYHRINLEDKGKIKKRSVVTVHHDIHDVDKWFNIENYLPQYKKCLAIICLNSNQKRDLINFGIKKDKLHIIPHGYNANKLKPKELGVKERPNKLTIGIFSKRYGRRVKGEAYLLELSKYLSKEHFRFILVGAERTQTAYELRKFGFDVMAYDYLPYNLMQSVYQEIDCLLMCSYFEGGPANIPESLATGTPVFANNIGLVSDMVEDKVNGRFLSMDAFEDAKILYEYEENREKLLVLSEGASKKSKELLNWNQVADRHIELYQNFLI